MPASVFFCLSFWCFILSHTALLNGSKSNYQQASHSVNCDSYPSPNYRISNPVNFKLTPVICRPLQLSICIYNLLPPIV